jgi:ligand-binding sensor domain-containing protein/signal transduction histidine kinase
METLKRTITILIICLPCLLLAQPAHFQHFNEKNGLSQNSINAIYQDSLGFLWVGTEEGLNRYDGTHFRVFRHLRSDTNSLSNSFVQSIFTGKDGKIWVGTQFGLNRFDPATEQFERFIHPDTVLMEAKNYIHKGTVDSEGFVWYGTYDGLFRLQPEQREWLHFPPDTSLPNGVSHNAVWSVFEDSRKVLWIGTSNGLSVFKNDGQFSINRYFHHPNNPQGILSERVFDFAETPDGTVWLATRQGLSRAEGPPEHLQFFHYKNNPTEPNSLSNDFVWSIAADDDGSIWLSTYGGGLNQVRFLENDFGKPIVTRHLHDEKQPNSIAHNEVNCALPGHSGILWAGTAAGLDKIDPSGSRFEWIQNVPDDPSSLRSDHVQALLLDSRGDLWVGTRDGGLHRLSSENLAERNYEFEVFKNDPNDLFSISHNDIFGLSEDSHGYLWITTYDGLNCLKLSENGPPKFHHFTEEDGVAYKFQYQVFQRKNGEHWVATYGRLNRMHFDPARTERTTFDEYNMDLEREDALVNATTHSLVEDRFGQLWVGTFNGISKLISADGVGTFENYLNDPNDPNSLSNNYVKQLYLDSKGRLWATTRSGLNFMEQTSVEAPVKFYSFGPAEGLPSETVQAICEDGEGRFWVSTIGGLALFDPEIALGKTGEMPVLQTFDYRDGLQGNEFCERAALRGPDGKMYFGGIQGLNIFDPKNLWENPFVPPVVFTEFQLFNQAVRPGEKGNPLRQSISQTRSITLKHWQNVIGFSFAALSFSQPEKNSYAYRMTGFDEGWIFSKNNNSATYTNLSPGNYRFEVKAANSSGIWNETPSFIDVTVLPPWWLTWWAHLIYGLVAVGTAVFFIRQREATIRQVEQAKAGEREILRKQNAADFHDELGHRLTKIALFLELAERQKEDSKMLSGYLSKVRHHAAGLSTGIRDLIWTLDPGADSLLQTLVRLREFGDDLFKRSGIKFQTSGISEEWEQLRLEPDVRKHLLLLFKEAMNNCLKYSQASRCHFMIEKTTDGFQIKLSDDGQGFDLGKTKQGYGLRNMQERAEKMGGIFQLESCPGSGTSILLKLKMPHKG